MLTLFARGVRVFTYRRWGLTLVPSSFLLSAFLLLPGTSLHAQSTEPAVTVGAGVRTSFTHTDPTGSSTTDQFSLNDIRIYVNGSATDNIKVMFNTDYDGGTNKVSVLDAVGRIELSPKVNFWFGRFLPPSDRANLAGPFYAHNWAVFTDGIQDGYPSVFQGRDNGVAYWGDFDRIKVSLGAFDGGSTDGDGNVIGAARVQINFWDREKGYYLNGTYYGDKNLLSIGGATQVQGGKTATTVDFLLERKVKHIGAFSLESEYANYNRLGGYDARYAKSQGAYALGSYIFPKPVGIGKFEVLGKYAIAEFTHGATRFNPSYRQNTGEVDFNYVIKEFNARIMSFYKDTRFNGVNSKFWQIGLGLQFQI